MVSVSASQFKSLVTFHQGKVTENLKLKLIIKWNHNSYTGKSNIRRIATEAHTAPNIAGM